MFQFAVHFSGHGARSPWLLRTYTQVHTYIGVILGGPSLIADLISNTIMCITT